MQFDSTYLWLLIPVALVGAILVAHGGVRKCLWAAGLTLLVLALARPQLGREEPSADGEGGDIFLVFDISRSMLGQDIPPNRIQFSLLFAERLVHELPGFRFALFPFAGDAYLQMPLTNDPDATVEMLSYLSPDVVTSPSSHLDNALKKLFETTQRLKVSSPQIVVFSDGEMEEPIGSDTLGLFIKHEIPIHTIAAATPQGANVPIESRFVSGAGSHGHLSQLNRALLEKLSNATGGRTFPARLDQVKAVTETLKPTGAHRLTFHPTMDLFPHLIALALIFFVWELSRRRWPVLLRSLVICSLVSAGTLARADEPVDPERQAILLFNRATGDEASGRFDDAQEGFQQAESLSRRIWPW
ncbi:MAG: VWA domain-containing protein [Deltaproteobacteria bacterium]|nr:VWA domain-containing protein [Deltaproteobacteria bacterium]